MHWIWRRYKEYFYSIHVLLKTNTSLSHSLVFTPVTQPILFSAMSQQVIGHLTAVVFFLPLHRNTRDSGARQWSNTDRRRPLVCPLWTLPPLTLVEQIRSSESKSVQSASCKERGIKKKRKKWEEKNTMKEEHTLDKGGEKEWKKKNQDTFF